MNDSQSSLPPAPGAAVTEAVGGRQSTVVTVAGLGLVAATSAWKVPLLAHSFFRLDDYFFLERATSQGLTWNYLTWINAGHLPVTGSLVAWFVERLSPLDWGWAAAVTFVLMLAAGVALLGMLRTLFGDHPAILLLLTIYLVSPLAFAGLTWWTVDLEQLPLQIALFAAVSSHVRYVRTGRFGHALAAAGWLAVGMASSFRGAAIGPLLFAVTAAYFVPGAWSPRAWWATVRPWWRCWLLYGLLTAGYVVLFAVRLRASTMRPAVPGTVSGVVRFVRNLTGDTLVPGLLGGPWRWQGTGVSATVHPPAALAIASWVVAAAVIGLSIARNRTAWRAWVIAAGWLLAADIAPVVLGRGAIVPGALLGLVTRYVWDTAGIVVLCLGLAYLPIEGGPRGDRFRRLPLRRPVLRAAAVVFAAMLIGSVWSARSYPIDPGAAAAKSYLATARVALAQAPKGTVIVDDPIPSDVIGGLFYRSVGSASKLLRPLITGTAGAAPVFVTQPDGTYAHLMEFDGWGRLVPAVVSGAGSGPLSHGATCRRTHRGTLVIPLNLVPSRPTTLRLGYLAGWSGQVRVQFGGVTRLYNFRPGLNSAFLPVHGTGARVTLSASTGNLPCIGDVQVGVLLPSGSGPAIPAAPVSGG